MLQTMQNAVMVRGRKNAAIARDIGREPATITAWFSGRSPVPARIRQALDAAIGSPVDWPAYDAEFAALGRSRRPAPAPAPVAAPKTAPAAPPPRPAEARRKTAEAQQVGGWGDDAQKAPAPAPAAPATRRGWIEDDPTFGGML